MTLDELKENPICNDLMFGYTGKDYFICPMGICSDFSVGEAYTNNPIDFKTFDELINNWMINGKPLKEIIEFIDPYLEVVL